MLLGRGLNHNLGHLLPIQPLILRIHNLLNFLRRLPHQTHNGQGRPHRHILHISHKLRTLRQRRHIRLVIVEDLDSSEFFRELFEKVHDDFVLRGEDGALSVTPELLGGMHDLVEGDLAETLFYDVEEVAEAQGGGGVVVLALEGGAGGDWVRGGTYGRG